MRILSILLTLTILLVSYASVLGEEFYVTLNGSGSQDGTSWANAWSWSDLDTAGNWAATDTVGDIDAGDTVYISGGASGVTYTNTLNDHASGESGNEIYIKTGAASPSPSGHSGMVTITDTDVDADGIRIDSEIIKHCYGIATAHQSEDLLVPAFS